MSASTSRFDLVSATLSWPVQPRPDESSHGVAGWSLVLAALVVLAFYAWFAGV